MMLCKNEKKELVITLTPEEADQFWKGTLVYKRAVTARASYRSRGRSAPVVQVQLVLDHAAKKLHGPNA